MKLFFHLMQTAACNAFLLAKHDQYSKTFLDFTESIAAAWLFQDRAVHAAASETGPTDNDVRLTEAFPCLYSSNSRQGEAYQGLPCVLQEGDQEERNTESLP